MTAHARPPPPPAPTNHYDPQDIEPDEEWKNQLKARIQLSLATLVQEAKDNQLKELSKTVVSPEGRNRLNDEYRAAMANIKLIANDQYQVELEKERNQRRWIAGAPLLPGWDTYFRAEQEYYLDSTKQTNISTTPTNAASVEIEALLKGEEVRRKDAEARLRVEEARKKAGEARKLTEELEYGEVQAVRAAEAREIEEGAKRKAEEARKKEDEVKKREMEVTKREQDANMLEEEVKRRENEAKKKEEATRKREESLRQESEKTTQFQQEVQRTAEEVREKQEKLLQLEEETRKCEREIQEWEDALYLLELEVKRREEEAQKTEAEVTRKATETQMQKDEIKQQEAAVKKREEKLRQESEKVKRMQQEGQKLADEAKERHKKLLQLEELANKRERDIREREEALLAREMELKEEVRRTPVNSKTPMLSYLAINNASMGQPSNRSSLLSIEDYEQYYQEQQQHPVVSTLTKMPSTKSSFLSVEDHEQYYQEQLQRPTKPSQYLDNQQVDREPPRFVSNGGGGRYSQPAIPHNIPPRVSYNHVWQNQGGRPLTPRPYQTPPPNSFRDEGSTPTGTYGPLPTSRMNSGTQNGGR